MDERMKSIVHSNCAHFRGDIPCKPHKDEGVHCNDCQYYEKKKELILVIKLGAIGDVIRTTPLLHRLKREYPDSRLFWLTETPAVVPDMVDHIFSFNPRDIEILRATDFDLLINLDKDREACALSTLISAKEKKGFILKNGFCAPLNEAAERKWITGLFDDENRLNTKSYPQEIFEICGWQFESEPYILDVRSTKTWSIRRGRPVIGLNTGCGRRWQTRLWPEKHWLQLAESLLANEYTPVLLGGSQEASLNERIAATSGADYPGHFDLIDFIGLVNECDLVVTAVTMALHIALGLKKKVVLFNNIFNPHEFEMYGLGEIIEPPKPCKGCFRNECDQTCMELIEPQQVLKRIEVLL
jgi:heptosyltransferase-2